MAVVFSPMYFRGCTSLLVPSPYMDEWLYIGGVGNKNNTRVGAEMEGVLTVSNRQQLRSWCVTSRSDQAECDEVAVEFPYATMCVQKFLPRLSRRFQFVEIGDCSAHLVDELLRSERRPVRLDRVDGDGRMHLEIHSKLDAGKPVVTLVESSREEFGITPTDRFLDQTFDLLDVLVERSALVGAGFHDDSLGLNDMSTKPFILYNLIINKSKIVTGFVGVGYAH